MSVAICNSPSFSGPQGSRTTAACYLVDVEHVVKRSLSFALLACHLLVFVLGAPLALSSTSRTSRTAAASHHAVVVASGYGNEGSAIAPLDNGLLEVGTRARGDRGARRDRGVGGLALDVMLPPALVAVGPAAVVGMRDWRSAARGHRSLPCVVNGARGPPPAAV